MNRLLLALGCGLLSFAISAPAPAAEPEAQAMRTIVLVRHGNYEADPAIAEKIGPPLSPIGVAQARLAGAALMGLPVHFDHLYASPMQRARNTAAVIASDFPGRKFEVIEDLAECTPPTRRTEATKDENPADLIACKDKLDRVFARFFKPASAGDQADMLVCHGNVIRYMVTRALGVDTTAWLEMSVGHASITTIRVEADGRFKVIAAGDAGHIPPNMRTGTTGDPARSLAIPLLLELPEAESAH
ncbi:MAG: histidine phosphatase family protein [Thermomonas sp.]